MSDRRSWPAEGRVANGIARAIVGLRFAILPAWVVVAALAAAHLPSAANTAKVANLLPHSSEAIEVERRAVRRFGFPLLSRTVAVARQPGGFSAPQLAAASRYVAAVDRRPEAAAELRAAPLLGLPGMLGPRHGRGTLVVYLYVDPALSEAEGQAAAERFAAGLRRASGAAAVEVTGVLPATAAETHIVNHDLLWVELATVALVVGLLGLSFRAVGIPLLGLATVAIAYLLADHALGWLGERHGLTLPREVAPVIVALLFGTLTDYLVFFVSGYRRRLEGGSGSREAVVAATAELLPVVATAALMIAGASLTLLISGVRFLSAFGPGMAVAVAIGAAVAMTFVPAALASFGPLLLLPQRPGRAGAAADRAEKGARGRLVAAAANHPVPVGLLCLLALLAAASGLRRIELGNPLIRGLPGSSSPRRGYDAAAAGPGVGVLGPTMLTLEEPGIASRAAALAALQARLSGQPGVAGVAGPADQPLRSSYGVFRAPRGDAARFFLVLEGDPGGAAAARTLSRLEGALPELLRENGLGRARVGVTGDTTIASELASGTWRAFWRVAPLALAVLLLLLRLLLGSWTAPLYLVGASALTVAAALGLTAYVFQSLLHYGELAFFVPIAAAILLLALGADYNIFLISRIWREAGREGLRPAIRVAGSRASRAITVAGLILAFSFAATGLIPILGFRELAFALFAGLLLDTLLARTLLIPALVSLFSRRQFAPGEDG